MNRICVNLLRSVANDQRIIGRFHFDFDQGDTWKKDIEGTRDEPGIILINPGEFGMSGTVIRQLPLDADASEIISAMTERTLNSPRRRRRRSIRSMWPRDNPRESISRVQSPTAKTATVMARSIEAAAVADHVVVDKRPDIQTD